MSRLIEYFTWNSSIAKDYVLNICEYYEIKCREASPKTLDLLEEYGVLERAIDGNLMTVPTELLNKNNIKELNKELEELRKYIILITEEDPLFFEVIEVEAEEDEIKFLIDYLEDQQVKILT
ncbi:MAG: hypothetical protein QW607_04495 [Desulfurococcaceae archaeon]